MKIKSLISILFFCLPGVVNAQMVELVGKNLAAYEGTWQYTTSTDTFVLVLKQGKSINRSARVEGLAGLYYYKQNGQVLNNYLNSESDFSLTDENKKKFPIFATNAGFQADYDKISPSIIRVDFYDYNKPRSNRGKATIELVSGKPNEAVWTIVYRKREVVNVEGLPDITPSKPVYVLPDTMVLKKIK